MTVTEVKMWKCSTTGKLFDSKEKAEKSSNAAKAKARREKEKAKKEAELNRLIKYQSNYIRLNATCLSDIPLLISTKAKEFWGIDLEAGISEGSFRNPGRGFNNDDGPYFTFNLVMGGPELSTTSKNKLRKISKNIDMSNIKSVILGRRYYDENPAGFVGIEWSSGHSGTFGGRNFSMSARILVNNFPLIKEKYDDFIKIEVKRKNYFEKYNNITSTSYQFADQIEEVRTQFAKLSFAERVLRHEQKKLETLRDYHSGLFKAFCLSKIESPPEIPPDLKYMFDS